MSVLERLRNGLIVSCQAYPGEPLRDPRTMAQMARSVINGGACAVRVEGVEDLRAIVGTVPVPVIGLWKDGDSGVYITPTVEHARAVTSTGVDIVAIDGTRRARPDGLTLAETVARIREHSDALIMADCGSAEDARAAESARVDILSTTLSGYTGDRVKTQGPDLALVDEIRAFAQLPLVVEGRIKTPDDARIALERGAFAVCVGTAITHPTSITRWFAQEVSRARITL
ncbi:N-acetylmannosamine-6-phosphate 2-epimerase [Georgenia sp. EYE_87]|uniref:N-acetylmannosamine-6-phosphate 2-epimerase n=1 Tax=Georgenia sp. EYE_87 TaxID=2853448 RepID=UPI00200368EF